MPFAKGVSAKSNEFDDKGNEIKTDYVKMLDIVLKKHNYRGYIGVEYEGKTLSEPDGIKATKKLLERFLVKSGSTLKTSGAENVGFPLPLSVDHSGPGNILIQS